jgi:hypothetical protein
MTKTHTFTATIQNAGDGGAYVEIPFDVEAAFGSKRPKVRATIGGEPYRGTLVRMGTECHLLPVLKNIREKIGKNFGDDVEVTLEEDNEPRVVEIPPDLAEAFSQNPEAEAAFAHLAYTHQKEYVRWIEEAKRDETRQKRILKAIEMLLQGKKDIRS